MILLDIGGTFVKCADGRQIPIASGGSREEIRGALREAVGEASGSDRLGVAIPGPFDFRKGIFLMKHKFAAVYGERFADVAQLPMDMDVRFLHDVNAVLLGAVRRLDLGSRNVALVTLGTGLGFACSFQGKIVSNELGSPLYGLWNIPLGDGILEDVVSARGISLRYEGKTGQEGESARSVAMKAHAGDEQAQDTYREVGEVLAGCLREQVDRLGLDTVLFGGQIAKSLDLMFPSLEAQLPDVKLMRSPEDAVFDGLRMLFD